MVWNKSGYHDRFTTQQLHIIKQREINDRSKKVGTDQLLKTKDSTASKDLILENQVSITIDKNNYVIVQYKNHTIHVFLNDNYVGDRNNKKHLRDVAEYLKVNIYNGNGNLKNTRTLGSDLIKSLSHK